MKTRLVGRVWVEQVEDATVVIIPAKRDWKIAFFSVWLVMWAQAERDVFSAWRSLAHPATADWFTAFWGLGWVAGLCFVGAAILWALGGVERVRISYTRAELTRSLFGLVFSRRVAPSQEIRNLRFVPASASGKRRRESRICFEDRQKTVKFGSGLGDNEALAVIERMLTVYPLSRKDRALGYIDLSS